MIKTNKEMNIPKEDVELDEVSDYFEEKSKIDITI